MRYRRVLLRWIPAANALLFTRRPELVEVGIAGTITSLAASAA